MNKNNAKDFLPLVQALAEGKTIQLRTDDGSRWVDLCAPAFNGNPAEYRIKPEPVELEVWYNPGTKAMHSMEGHHVRSDWHASGYHRMRVREIEEK